MTLISGNENRCENLKERDIDLTNQFLPERGHVGGTKEQSGYCKSLSIGEGQARGGTIERI